MKKILIINLRRIGDVYTTGHLLNSLVKNHGSHTSLLIYKETEKAAVNLKNIVNIHTIDRKEILMIKSSKLFSDGFAIEQLFNQLQFIKNQKWDEIINYSNDTVGAYICSYLKDSAEKITGVHFNNNKNVLTGSNWEILFNDILPSIKYAPIHFVDCYHKMAETTLNCEGEKVITSAENNTIAFNYMKNIRKDFSPAESSSKIVGIQLKTANIAKDIPEKIMTDLLRLIKLHHEIIPILLIAPNEEERKRATEINNQFNNELIIVEADLQAISSILMNIDVLITPDTAVKHIADLTETPVIEISLGHAPFLKQGSYSTGSLILTDLITTRNFTSDISQNAEEAKTNITAQDIISSLMYYFTKTKSTKPKLSQDVTLYNCSLDQQGVRYSVVAGTVDTQIEIHRLMSRQLINLIYNQHESNDLYSEIIHLGINATTTWCTIEKTHVTNVTRDLLGTLRPLLRGQENKKISIDFVNNLAKLIGHSEQNSLIQIPVMMFKTKIESINPKTFKENAKEVETLIYDLKSDIQKVSHCINKLEDKITIQKKEIFMNRSSEAIDN